MSVPLIISLVAVIVSIVCLGLMLLVFKRSNNQLEALVSQRQLVAQISKEISVLKEDIHEIRSGNHGVNSRFKALVQQVNELQSVQQNLVEQDPQSRFYSKGAKLISQGASLEDVMRECDMPAAEAELLFNLHNSQR